MANRVLNLIDHFGLGGAQRGVRDIFNQDNYNIFLYVLRTSIDQIHVNHNNFKICSSDGRYSLRPIWEIIEIIRKFKPDILHCHLFRSQVLGWLIKKFFCPELIFIFHERGFVFESRIRGQNRY